MSPSKSSFMEFAQTLENKIREDLFASHTPEKTSSTSWFFESRAVIDTEPSCLSQLLGSIALEDFSTLEKSPNLQRTPYGKLIKPAPVRPDHRLNETQTKAFETLQKLGAELKKNFSKAELKKAFRAVALKHHPDRGGRASDFMLIKPAIEALSSVF